VKIIGRTHHYLVSVLGSRWDKVSLVMFTAYIDDAGTRPNHKVAVAAALIIPSCQVLRLEDEWNTFKDKEGFSAFHASPCDRAAPASPFDGWDEEKRDRVFARVRQISMKYGVKAISGCVVKDFFDRAVPADYRKYTFNNHFTWCAAHVITYAYEFWNAGKNCFPLEFIFDWFDVCDPHRIEIDKIMGYSERASREAGNPGKYENFTFKHKEGFPGLQCVDDIAWVTNHYSLNLWYDNHPLVKRVESGWNSFGKEHARDDWHSAFTSSQQQIESFIAKELKDGRTIERFKRWEREDREKANGVSGLRPDDDGTS
jgi:hypothetical protein